MNPMEAATKKQQERETLRNVIAQWNANRLDLFELSEPNEDLEFHGVMRFYFQDSGQKVATKCIRVASDATSQAVIETLIEKFRADMRMLSLPEYALYEIHENGDERRLGMDEKPLLVQLNWHMDDREGRFLLRRIDDKTNVPAVGFQEGGSSFRRKLSKREKKQLKKQEKLNKLKMNAPTNNENNGGVAGKLYTELPETSFTRSISNPEAVMRRRRQQKLERKLQQFRSKDGGPDTGGTLKIYGESLCRDVPYKTLLLSVRDTAQQVVKEMLTKYGLDRETDPHNYCLVQVNTAVPADNGESKEYHGGTNNREYILDDDECPLAILMNHPSSRGSIMFHVRRRPADYHPRKRKKKPQQKWNKGSELMDYRYEDGYDRLPFFLELNPDGTDIINGTPKRHRLHPNVTEVGSERPINTAGSQQHGHQSQSLQLFGPNVQPRHCVIAHTEGIVTVTPCSGNAETYVNGQRIYETTILQNGAIVKFGRIHNFRFIDPSHDDRSRQRHDSARQALDFNYDRQSSREDTVSHGGASTPGHNNNNNIGNNNNNSTGPNGTSQNYETTFDVDGNVETVSTSSLGNKEETRSQRSVSSSRDGNRLSNYERYPRGTDPILPAVLEFREETEEAFLHAVVTDLDPAAPHFKLAPTYTLYLVARYRASTHYRPELTPTERAHRLTVLLARVAAIIHNVIQERYADAKSLAFWMANSSELLHFLKSDRHISAFSLDAQDILADCVQIAFKNLVSCLQGDLAAAMPHFMSERDDNTDDENTATVLQVLTSAMALLRRCRVNAALTIQLFSQLFHFINMWSFNKVVTSPTSPHPQQPHSVCYCTRAWGLRLKSKLAQLEAWAERQGLELAADCHLARIIQASHLLQAPKYNADDLATLSSTCFKLNSLQLRALLSKYQPAPDEPRLPHELIENVVRVAENVADELARSDGREVRLEEERELQLPFLLPEDGYSCDVVRGVPQGLAEFLAPLQHAGLCRMSTQPTSSGLWTIYMTHESNPGARSPSALSNRSGGYPPPQQEPEIQVIKLNKSNNGMGLSIVAAKGAGQDRLGIYIKSVVKGGAADADGQLQAGDQLLKVDGQSLVGITQEKAAEYLVRTGPTATLEVAKQGAIYHGLATLLQQPSPVMGRAPNLTGSRPNSELLTPTYNVRPSRGHLPLSMSLANLPSSASTNKRHQSTYQERLFDWNSQSGPRRMSERDLPSRLLSEQNHSADSRRNIAPHAPMQSSKSVPSLNSGNNDLVHGPTSPGSGPSSTPGSKQHEVFNPGYSRTSSTNSIPQKTYEAQSQPASGAGIRSKSSQNLNDPRSPTSALPPSGLGSRQSSNPSLHHSPHLQSAVPPHHMNQHPHPSQVNPQHLSQNQHPPLHINHHPPQPLHPSQMLPQHPSQNQQQQHPSHTQHPVNQQNQMQSQQGSDGERFYQNLSIYRNNELHNGYPPPSPNRGKLPSPQGHEDRSPTHQQKSLRGSQSSLHRPPDGLQSGTRDRPASAYIPQKDQYGSPQHGPGMAPRSQSTRDIMRQEAKLQEMQEEVRRREMRGGVTSPQHYPLQPVGHTRPQMLPGHPQRVPNTSYPYHNQDPNNPVHPQHNNMLPYSHSPAHGPPQSSNSHRLSPSYSAARPHMGYAPPPTAPKPARYPGPVQAGSELQRPPFPTDPHHQNALGQEIQGQVRPPLGSDAHGSVQSSMPPEDAGYRDSPPPPPPPTSTHPLYQSGSSNVGQKLISPSGNPDNRYTASMGEPPRGTYYPASPGTGNQPPRHYQFNATNPWEREEREKESVERVQGLLRMATQQQDDTDHSRTQQQNVRRPQLTDFQQNGRSSVLPTPQTMPKSPLPSGGNITADDKEKTRRAEEIKRKQTEVDSSREQEDRMLHESSKRRDDEVRLNLQHQVLQQPVSPQQSQNQILPSSSQSITSNMSRPLAQVSQPAATTPNNNQYMLPAPKLANPSHLRLDNLVINGPASPPQVHHSSYQSTNPHQQYNGYLTSQSSNSSTTTASSYYQHDHNKLSTNAMLQVSQNTTQKVEPVNYYQHQESNANSKPVVANPVSPLQQSGAQRLDSLLLMSSSQQTNSLNERNSNLSIPPQPPERGSSFTVMSQTQGVLRNSTTNMSLAGSERSNMVHNRGSETNPTTSTTIKRVSFHDPNANQPPPQPTTQPPMEQIREDPNHFINEAETLLASPKSPDGGPFSGNTPGVIGAQEVYKDPRARLLAAQQHQKLLSTRSGPLPEKLSFKEKMKMFAMETGEDGTPRDKVKISRAQREIDNLGTPTGSNNNGN